MDTATSFEFSLVEQYVKNYLRKHYWKVERSLTYDDAMQEARIMFWQLTRRMDRRNIEIDGPKHMMALFKSSWSRRFTTLANEATVVRKELVLSDLEPDNQEEDSTSVADLLFPVHSDLEDGFFEKLVEQSPTEVRQVLLLLWTAPKEVLALVFASKRTSNRKLCMLLGYAPTTDLLGSVKRYFS